MSLRPSDIPADVVAELNAGTRETANLAEGLALDMRVLVETVAYEWQATVDWPTKPTITKAMDAVGRAASEQSDSELKRLAEHRSDTVRGWACFAIGHRPRLTLNQRLKRIQPLADDPHFGVREWAWLGIRQHLIDDIEQAIGRLTPWTTKRSEYLRRFASEATRPRGVWCKHCNELKTTPELALSLLEPLKSDSSKYVQDSVANWLNDAGKTRPDWVREVCDRWIVESETPETTRIVKRAMRNL